MLLIIAAGDIKLYPGQPQNVCKNTNICHVNIRSLSRGKFNAIKVRLAKTYDIITISETHLHSGIQNNVFYLEGYHEIISKDRKGLVEE